MWKDFESHFQKVFEFERTHEWRLPKTIYSASHFKIWELQDMKHQLNNVKSQLPQIENFDLSVWHDHTEKLHIANHVNKKLQRTIKPELLTKAFSKFYEIFSKFPIVPSHDFNSLHLCEAPGASICALNHWIVLNYPNIQWQWKANTLNPYYEGNSPDSMVDDDRLIRFTKNHWLFGIDNTGDILQFYNHVDFVKYEKYELVTADGSIDCSKNPGEQEVLVEFLQYCETMTTLRVLKYNGSFILKIFTIFEESTICLIYLLICLFNKTYLFKPCTSKPGNSELYLVCIEYNDNVLNTLWDSLIIPYKNGCFDKNVSMFSLDEIPNSFLIQLKSCCSDFFLEKQIDTINDNINKYYYRNYKNKDYENLKNDFANYFIKKFKLKPIPKNQKIYPYANIHSRQNFKKFEYLSDIQKVSLQNIDLIECVKISFCKRIEVVASSKFTLKLREQQIKLLNLNKNHPSDLYNLVLNSLRTTITVINVKTFTLSPQYKFQKDLFDFINNSINNEKHIIFINIPFFTHFLVSLWSILGMAFDRIYFKAGWCLFYKPLPEKVKLVKNVFDKVTEAYNNMNICNSAFSCDIYSILSENIFRENLEFVCEVMDVCNNLMIP